MDEEGIKTILEGMGLHRIHTGDNGIWVRSSCPFIYRHSNAVDRHPSFGVSIHPDKPSTYTCFTCKRKGPLSVLLKKAEDHLGRKYDDELHRMAESDGAFNAAYLQDKLKKAELWNPSITVNGVRISKKKAESGPVTCQFSEDELASMRGLSLEVMLYLTGPDRKLTQETVDLWELGWNPVRSRIMIPIRDAEGKLLACSGRLFGQDKTKKNPKYMHSKGFRRDFVLFGEHLKTKSRKCYLVEGFFHTIYMYQLGYRNVLGVMGVYLSEIQEKKVKKWFDEVVVLADGDKAGTEMADRVADALKGDCVVRVAHCEPGMDANDLSPEEIEELVGPPNLLD